MGKWMIIGVSIKAHNAFHAIFGNRTPEEQLLFLRNFCDDNGILNLDIYTAYKDAFDAVFFGNISYIAMSEVLKRWDLPSDVRENNIERLTTIYGVLNNEISGGIPLKKFKLN